MSVAGGEVLKAPFPAIGGKSKCAHLVWPRLGEVRNYIEPFAFSAAMLLLREPAGGGEAKIETINDVNCYVANFWRAVQADPDAVAAHADWPVNEADMHARHRWLVLSEQAIDALERVREEPEFFDARIAGWWCWGQCCWIGAGWCSNNPAAASPEVEGRPVLNRFGEGLNSKRAKLSQQVPDISGDGGAAGRGVHSSAGPTRGVDSHQRPAISESGGKGLRADARPQLADEYARGRGVNANDSLSACEVRGEWVRDWMRRLSDRLRAVRVCCGDWARVCSSRSVTTKIGVTGVFLDPPYRLTTESGGKNRDGDLYASDFSARRDGGESADGLVERVNAWCVEWGGNRQMRIAVCGLDGEHNNLESLGWDKVEWKSSGGYGNRNPHNDTKHRERVWFSPACLTPENERTLFCAVEGVAG